MADRAQTPRMTDARPTRAGASWRRTSLQAPVPPAPTGDVARELADQLRLHGDALMPGYVAGPIVVLDIDAGTVMTLCDQTAIASAQRWGQMLTDRARAAPACRGTSSQVCTQMSPTEILMIDLVDPDAWRIVSVIVGNHRKNRAALHANLATLRGHLATATCP